MTPTKRVPPRPRKVIPKKVVSPVVDTEDDETDSSQNDFELQEALDGGEPNLILTEDDEDEDGGLPFMDETPPSPEEQEEEDQDYLNIIEARTIFLKVPSDFLEQLDTDGHVSRPGGLQFFPELTGDIVQATEGSAQFKLYALTIQEVVYEDAD